MSMSSTDIDSDLFSLIHARLPDLAAAQRLVAKVFLDKPEWAMQAHVNEIAVFAGVSEPTVVRFCRALGFHGLRDFKLRVAQQVALGSVALHRNVTAVDSIDEIVGKVLRSSADILLDIERQLPREQIKRAISALGSAHRVDCYGVGTTSGFVAADAQARLFRFGIQAQTYTDANMQMFSAATLSPGDGVIAVSHFGRMPFLLEAVRVARERGAVVIGICEPGTPLAGECDIPLTFALPASVNAYIGSDACIAHLAIIDILIVGVAFERGAAGIEQLRRLQNVLSPHGLDIFPRPASNKKR
ncbi:SIS domain protein [Burkholderia oklahomensis]|uniref:SIS domain protein n=2 Tax=Burkholderia oklahomensis TaxID=342113 RepID=A0AAI8B900_9BURK|nr:MurR/RpiR family transcriptional regulator [Burkholderia oklahomensis]AIO67942.1 SIS domain protein [Burkholderia oklahomensis]AJX32730.1 SIS domain protein [Burkholderia oklahomensis C6786]AOI43250.1 RpiR family transcriptional regulator [Burkholderia oklahomensis EO147]AOI46823.1 RpiR family transcriptional regulator [Burkholderia oklahomensis C6786]KUY47530.1 RpiR family transcriptional regulator [Burkholderia oklahomensis EO147]